MQRIGHSIIPTSDKIRLCVKSQGSSESIVRGKDALTDADFPENMSLDAYRSLAVGDIDNKDGVSTEGA